MTRLTTLDRSVNGRVALVTGAASGMGRAISHLLADEGASVVVLDQVAEGVDRVADEIEAVGGQAMRVVLDVRDRDAIAALPARVRDELGPLDILINNAGVMAVAPIASEEFASEWDRAIAINLSAHAHFIRAFLSDLKRDGEGRVVNIASTEGIGASAYASPYTASKHGVIGLTRALAVELGTQGVTVNCVCPGPIRTGMTEIFDEAQKTKFARRRVPLGRYGEPEEVAHATFALILPAASFTQGAVVVVDGGLTVQNT